MINLVTQNQRNSGEFVTLGNERFYAIYNADKIEPFFISLISNSDHWLFISSTGGLTAGRVSPETALFTYVTVDKIHESSLHTGSKTLIRIDNGDQKTNWEPFNTEHNNNFKINRNLYKNILGNKLCFEEINHDLQLIFRYTWLSSEKYGFIRQCELQNIGEKDISAEVLDGLQNILPAGTPRFTQTNSSNLVDAYKWSELDEQSGLAFFTLYSGITDRAEPCESLKANTVFCLGLDDYKVLLSSSQLDNFRQGNTIEKEVHRRGLRGAYLVNKTIDLAPYTSKGWQLVADLEQSQAQAARLRQSLADPVKLEAEITHSIDRGSDELARIMAGGDGFQLTAEENVTVHHYANVLFNILRGGAFDDQYQISAKDFVSTVNLFNRDVYHRHQALFKQLPEKQEFTKLLSLIKQQQDPQLERLCYEYLPISFGRRHGDPSRPWNQFAIKLIDENNNRLLTYQGNWRDIFQNWEALTFSYPEFIENVITKFVNASTMDGHNPYRITKEGFDWEVEEPNDPWSYIGYWGDHQIIYLLKMLELSHRFHPKRLGVLLRLKIYSYANVPYRIRSFEALLQNAKSTVTYDEVLAEKIEQRVCRLGADGKLILDNNEDVYQVNLLEKLLVPLLCKLGNFVVDGGIWLNTQRPEWNDANNALVGQGLSMVTLCYLRRYIAFLEQLLTVEVKPVNLSKELSEWLKNSADALKKVRPLMGDSPIDPEKRFQCLKELGLAASDYRETVYRQEMFSGIVSHPIESVKELLSNAMAAVEHTINTNQRKDGLYNAYNLIDFKQKGVSIDRLYPMLEGQVAVLSSGAYTPEQSITILERLFDSEVYRPDQHSFMLYPDRTLPKFLQKNQIPASQIETIPLLQKMLSENDERIVVQDVDGIFRFSAEFKNAFDLERQLDSFSDDWQKLVNSSRKDLLSLYEEVVNHKAFTGRSGGMFGFEGLGCIYWHMVSKLLLSVAEIFFTAIEQSNNEATCHRLAQLYYRIREGIGFNKTPEEYGAFPTDPYSHTPKHAGAQQPGMTGQVKEDILARFGELGIRVNQGKVVFRTNLLRSREFLSKTDKFRYLDVEGQWQKINVPEKGLAFSWCQIPVLYLLDDEAAPCLIVTDKNGSQKTFSELALPSSESEQLFSRNGSIRQLTLRINTNLLYSE